MTPKTIRITLKSASTFGRGDGLAGQVDREIEHDSNGFPFLRGKTLKGLLAESAENVVYALAGDDKNSPWYKAKENLFGKPGRGEKERGMLHIGDAQLPSGLRKQLADGLENKDITPEDVLFSLSGIRRQTAMNPDGGPERATLRAMRVLLPGVMLEAGLSFDRQPDPVHLQLLAAAILDLRRAGTGRNRGRGHISAVLNDETATRELFEQFAKAV